MDLRKVVLLAVWLLNISGVRSQDTLTRVYSDDNGNLVSFYKNKVLVRISNEDAFATYSIGYGLFTERNGKNLRIGIIDSAIIGKTSSLSMNSINDNESLITIKTNTGDPWGVVQVSLLDRNRNELVKEFTNTEGQLNISPFLNRVKENEVFFITVKSIGFSTEKKIFFNRGIEYIIESEVSRAFPFHILKRKDKVKIEIINEESILVNFDKHKFKLRRQKYNKIFSEEMLFE